MLEMISKRIEQLQKDLAGYPDKISFDQKMLKELKTITLTLNLRLYRKMSKNY